MNVECSIQVTPTFGQKLTLKVNTFNSFLVWVKKTKHEILLDKTTPDLLCEVINKSVSKSVVCDFLACFYSVFQTCLSETIHTSGRLIGEKSPKHHMLFVGVFVFLPVWLHCIDLCILGK